MGQKISKTKGNVIDPLDLMDEFGTDALRFTILVGSTPGNDTNVGPRKVEANRNFANKIWNVGRFVVNAVNSLTSPSLPAGEGIRKMGEDEYTLADSWIWAKLQQLIRDVERQFQNFQYGQAGQQIYDFIWSDFADWYVEIAKEQLKDEATRSSTVETLTRVFEMSLRLLHPFTPFVTEEIWGHLRSALLESPLKSVAKDWPDALIIAKWPEPREPESWEESKIADFELIQGIHRSIRNLRAEKNVSPKAKLPITVVAHENTDKIAQYLGGTVTLSGIDPRGLSVTKAFEYNPDTHFPLNVTPVEIYIPSVELGASPEERTRLEKELKEAQSQIERLEKLLSSDFANKAPAALVQKEREKLEGYKGTAEKIKAQLK